MSEPPRWSRFSCPHCGKRYDWRAELEGKAVRCRCGATFVVTLGASGEVLEPAAEPFRDEPLPARAPPRFVPPPRTRRAAHDMLAERHELGAIREVVVPAVLVAVGLVGRAWQCADASSRLGLPLASGVVGNLVEFTFGMLAAVGGLYLGARMFDLEIEGLGLTLLKLAGIVAPTGVLVFVCGSVVDHSMSGADVTLALPAMWVATALLLSVTFGLDAWDAWRTAAVIHAIRITFMVGIVGAMGVARARAVLFGV